MTDLTTLEAAARAAPAYIGHAAGGTWDDPAAREFYFTAREAVPLLIEEVRRLQTENARLKEAMSVDLSDYPPGNYEAAKRRAEAASRVLRVALQELSDCQEARAKEKRRG